MRGCGGYPFISMKLFAWSWASGQPYAYEAFPLVLGLGLALP
ncbi:hypothetical protein HMPREF1556_00363 [Porphyromonas sp. oral taxon 278 str. W7784]|nr:hypothetical protein HMPREF1556_00363 [Porphyromonas sp. oral taxon 278 str. W7784]